MIKTALLLFISALCPLFSQTAAQGPELARGGGYFQALIKEAKSRIREIDIAQLQKLREGRPSPVLVDVREDNEWNRNRIPGAIHVGRGVLESRIESQIPDKSTPVVVYCQSGGRSAVAADVLTKMGYVNVSSLAGGILAYQASALPVDQSTPQR